MSFFEECLTLGQWLGQDNSRALYKFLLKNKGDIYKTDSKILVRTQKLDTSIANGELFYFVENGLVKFKCRENGSVEFTGVIREIKLSKLNLVNTRKLQKFFAQCEVDVIHNFPLPGVNLQNERSFTYNFYPYYELSYYSNGKNKVVGLIKKLRTDDSEILKKLSA